MKKINFTILFLVLVSFFNKTNAEVQLTQTIRGTIIDKNTRINLVGANVILLNSNPIIGTTTDIDGKFRLENIKVGRIGLKISYIGYNDIILQNLTLTTGKELVLNLELEEKILTTKEVVISANRDKTEALNKMSTVSARSFSIEESQRFAGSRNDVARMAQNFAGVTGSNDGRNDIIIRGNSPTGLLWRLEGVDIPSPNHWAAFGTTGGPVCMLNNNLLSNSDFMSGAFAAEYGNAIAGAFDLHMRSGNNEKHEFLGQMGFNGIELGLEGPISRKNGSSYLINYRYSNLALMAKMGMDFGTGTGIPYYQDMSFKLNFPNTKIGSISLFGLGGISDITFKESEQDTTKEKIDFYGGDGFDLTNGSDMGVIGLNDTYIINKTTYAKITLATSYHNTNTALDSISPVNHSLTNWYRHDLTENKYIGSFYVNKKINIKNNLKIGMIYTISDFDFIDSAYIQLYNRYDNIVNFNGQTSLLQSYMQWQYRLTNDIVFNTGLHYEYFLYNNTKSIEPRFGVKWNFAPTQALSFGYGMHSQMNPITVYFNEVRLSNGSYIKSNKNLDLIHSEHFVLGYDWNFSEFTRLKFETYYQKITKAGVDKNESNNFSILNQGANFGVWTPEYLKSTGKGTNYGIELTLEQFMKKGFYYLFTTSLYDSRYVGSDGIERNTAFNGIYNVNLLLGKEIILGAKKDENNLSSKNQKSLMFDLKATRSGGQRYTPINVEQSLVEQKKVYYEDQAFSKKFKDYFRTDLRVAFRLNGKKVTQEWALDITNLFNTQNIYNQKFNKKTGEISYTKQMGIMIIPQYKIQF